MIQYRIFVILLLGHPLVDWSLFNFLNFYLRLSLVGLFIGQSSGYFFVYFPFRSYPLPSHHPFLYFYLLSFSVTIPWQGGRSLSSSGSYTPHISSLEGNLEVGFGASLSTTSGLKQGWVIDDFRRSFAYMSIIRTPSANILLLYFPLDLSPHANLHLINIVSWI